VAWQEGKKFRVVVMDSRPQLEGRALLRRLLSHGIACTYVLLNAASYIMSEVTKVLHPHCYTVAQLVIQYTACLPSGCRCHWSAVLPPVECYLQQRHDACSLGQLCAQAFCHRLCAPSGASVYITCKACMLCWVLNMHLFHSISVILELLHYFPFLFVLMLSIQ